MTLQAKPVGNRREWTVLLSMGLDPWAKEALCVKEKVHPEKFFLKEAEPDVRQVCMRCPVRAQCLAEFRADPWAFAGGMSAEERRHARSRRLL